VAVGVLALAIARPSIAHDSASETRTLDVTDRMDTPCSTIAAEQLALPDFRQRASFARESFVHDVSTLVSRECARRRVVGEAAIAMPSCKWDARAILVVPRTLVRPPATFRQATAATRLRRHDLNGMAFAHGRAVKIRVPHVWPATMASAIAAHR
jgi:hypothetical protein